jgi:hypothetical protein
MAENTAFTGYYFYFLISSIFNELSRLTLHYPPPYYGKYGNLYDADTPPSAQPRSPPPLSLTLKRLRSHRTPRMGHVLLKLTNHSLRSPGIHVTFSQTLSLSLLLSLSPTLKQTPLKSSLKGLIIATIPVPLRLHVIYGSRFK